MKIFAVFDGEKTKPIQSQSVRSVDAAPNDAPALSVKELPD